MKCISMRRLQKKSQQNTKEATVTNKSTSTVSNVKPSFAADITSPVLEKHSNLKSELAFIQNKIQNKQTKKYKDIFSSSK